MLEALQGLGIPFEVLPCAPEAADTAIFCERYGVAPERSANTILVCSKKEPRSYAACVIQACNRLDVNHKVCELMGVSRASFASAEETVRVTGMQVGGVTPFGLPSEIPIFVDEGVLRPEHVILGGGGRTTKIRLSPEGLLSLPGVAVVPGLAQPKPAPS